MALTSLVFAHRLPKTLILRQTKKEAKRGWNFFIILAAEPFIFRSTSYSFVCPCSNQAQNADDRVVVLLLLSSSVSFVGRRRIQMIRGPLPRRFGIISWFSWFRRARLFQRRETSDVRETTTLYTKCFGLACFALLCFALLVLYGASSLVLASERTDGQKWAKEGAR